MTEPTFEPGERVAITAHGGGNGEMWIGEVIRETKQYYVVQRKGVNVNERYSKKTLNQMPNDTWHSIEMTKLTPEFVEKVRIQNLRRKCKSILSDITVPEDANEVGWLYAELIIIRDRQAARKSR